GGPLRLPVPLPPEYLRTGPWRTGGQWPTPHRPRGVVRLLGAASLRPGRRRPAWEPEKNVHRECACLRGFHPPRVALGNRKTMQSRFAEIARTGTAPCKG